MISPINLLGNMSEKEFTQKFWGKTPCHIGSVIENYSESITSKYLKNVKRKKLYQNQLNT